MPRCAWAVLCLWGLGCGGAGQAEGNADASGLADGSGSGLVDEVGDDDGSVDASRVDASLVDAGRADTPDATGSATSDAAPPLDAAPEASTLDAPTPPSCAARAACPAPPAVTEGAGPVAIERCAFVLEDDGKRATYEAAIAGLTTTLKTASIGAVLAAANRDAVAVSASKVGATGFVRGFAWDADDEGKAWWIPQGISGSFDASASGTVAGKKVVAVSWYYDKDKHPGSTGEKGIRLSLADVTGATVKYRHLLLVAPKMVGGRADFDPIDIHAGGIAWVGDKLWVADTVRGLRVFDLSRILKIEGTADSIGWDGTTYQGGLYAYVVPQAGFWVDASACRPNYSFLAFDRTSSSLVTGEYSATTSQGRVFRWPVDPTTGALAAKTYADGAWVMGQQQVQGAVTRDGAFYFSSSKPPLDGGVLYAARPAKKTLSYGWVDWPEDLMFDTLGNQLWSLSEGVGVRYVFATDAGVLKAP